MLTSRFVPKPFVYRKMFVAFCVVITCQPSGLKIEANMEVPKPVVPPMATRQKRVDPNNSLF